MELYFAPLEGITGRIYRNAHCRIFGGIDRYYAPFIFTNPDGKISRKDIYEIGPDYNRGYKLIPQVLSNDADSFIRTARELQKMGFDEVNLNAGCPSVQVVRKGRGAGFLKDPAAMDAFFDRIFSQTPIDISVKTRIGIEHEDEYGEILEVYRKYPFKEVIVHPRLRNDYYLGKLHMDSFRQTLLNSGPWPVCYNGDIFTVEDFEHRRDDYPQTDHFMIGRGLLTNPALAREIRGGKSVSAAELEELFFELYEGYSEFLNHSHKAVFLMKEQWLYHRQIMSDEDQEEVDRALHTNEEGEFLRLSRKVYENCRIIPGKGYRGLRPEPNSQ